MSTEAELTHSPEIKNYHGHCHYGAFKEEDDAVEFEVAGADGVAGRCGGRGGGEGDYS
jgi:hypothetical protein